MFYLNALFVFGFRLLRLLSEEAEQVRSAPMTSDVNLFRNLKGIVNFDAEISDRAFDLGVPE